LYGKILADIGMLSNGEGKFSLWSLEYLTDLSSSSRRQEPG
jgi:hypothetical protein